MTQPAHVHGPGGGPEAAAKIEAMKRQWAQKKRIGERLGKIRKTRSPSTAARAAWERARWR